MPPRRAPIVLALALAFMPVGCQAPEAPVRPAGEPAIARPSAGPAPGTPAASSGPPAAAASPQAATLAPRAIRWLAFGDSLTADAFAHPGAWQAAFTRPLAVIDAGVRGDTTTQALARVDAVLAASPDASFVGLAFGTNDTAVQMPIETFGRHLRTLVATIRAAGRTVAIARIPYSPDARLAAVPDYNQAIDTITRELGLPAGPDLYAAVKANPGWIGPDGVHMAEAGNLGIQQAWAETAHALGLP